MPKDLMRNNVLKEVKQVLKGKKVHLRPVKRSDISLFLKWFNDPEVTQYLTAYLPLTEMEEEKWLDDLAATRAKTDVILVIEAIIGKSSIPIGSVGLHKINPKDQTAVLGMAIGEKNYWGRGYGTEAARLILDYGFKTLNLNRVSSSAFDFNDRSINMHRKIGFKEEGRLRKARFINGQFHDEVLFGLLRNDWNRKEK